MDWLQGEALPAFATMNDAIGEIEQLRLVSEIAVLKYSLGSNSLGKSFVATALQFEA